MKDRIIGALFILVALLTCYFAFNGALMWCLIAYSLGMAVIEIESVANGHYWLMVPDACPPRKAWIWEYVVLCMAFMACWFLKRNEFVLIVLVSVASDTCAFMIGKLFGKHHFGFTKKISPGKTIEGFIGGMFAPLAVLPICHFFNLLPITTGLIIFVVFGGIIAEIGDLLGSASKRQLGLKDSGQILATTSKVFFVLEYPVRGHGGYLDRVDSLSLNVVFFAVIRLLASF